MIVLEYLLYGVCALIGYIVFRIAWYFFPNIISRKDKYHTSNWDLLKNRFAYALAHAIVLGGFVAIIVYCLFNPDNFKEKVPTVQAVETVSEKKTNKNKTSVVSQKKEEIRKNIVSDTLTSSPSNTYKKFIKQWDEAHNGKQWELLEAAYMDYIRLDGKELSKEEYITKKKVSLIDNQYVKQRSTLLSCKEIEPDYIKCELIQKIKKDGQEEEHNLCLFLRKTENGNWQIEIEEHLSD